MGTLSPVPGAVFALVSALAGQSPLTTLYSSNNQGSVGGAVYFDLNAAVEITLTRIDLNLAQAAGVSGTLQVLLGPATHVGAERTPAVWSIRSSAPVLSQGVDQPTSVVLTAPVRLTAGRHGVQLALKGLAHAYTSGNGTNQQHATAELILTAGSAQNVAQSAAGPVFAPRVWNGALHYAAGAGFATLASYGAGCVDRPITTYEHFPAGGFDLSGSNPPAPVTRSLRWTPDGRGGYQLAAGSNAWSAPASPDLGLGDDATTLPLGLPFTLTYPGGSSTAIRVCSNGFVWLGTDGEADPTPSVAELLACGSRVCVLWSDLDPSAGGSVHFDVVPGNTAVHVTWLAVPEFAAPTSTCTMQLRLQSDGVIELRWRQSGNAGGPGLVGFSQGGGVPDPGGLDLSAVAAAGHATGPGATALALAAATRPVLGTVVVLTTANFPAGALLGMSLLSHTRHDPGLPLGSMGMPGCHQYVGTDVTGLLVPSGGVATMAVTLPGNPVFAGVDLLSQSLAFAPGLNPLGLVASNGLHLITGMR